MGFRKNKVTVEDELNRLVSDENGALALFDAVAADLDRVADEAGTLEVQLTVEATRLSDTAAQAHDREVSARRKADLLRGLFQ